MTNYWEISDREELKAFIEEQKKALVVAQKALADVKASVNQDRIKSKEAEIKAINAKRYKLENALEIFKADAIEFFLNVDGKSWNARPEYQRYSQYYGSDTNIQGAVLAVIKKHVRISKLSKNDVERLVLELILRYKDDKYGKVIQEKVAKINDLKKQVARIEALIEEDKDRIYKAQCAVDRCEGNIQGATENLNDEKRWQKVAVKEKRLSEKQTETEKAFSDEVFEKIYQDCIKGTDKHGYPIEEVEQ